LYGAGPWAARGTRALVVGVAGSAMLAPPANGELTPAHSGRLRSAVTVGGILGHERALQSIANANGGTRASGTPGFAASADYVAGRLERAGY
jgi:hypothetical protein